MQNRELADAGFVALPGAAQPSCVYALLAQGEVIYVGQTKNIYQRMYSHYNAKMRGYRKRNAPPYLNNIGLDDIRARAIPYDAVMVRFCAKYDLNRLEIEFIERYRPKYNIANRRIDEAKFNVNIAELAKKVGVPWNLPSTPSWPGPRRRRIAA